jgi:hydroxyacylglutathione hydrolase
MTWEVFTGGFCQTNAYLLDAGGRRLLVDAPDDCAEWLRGLGVKVDALLLTHQHFDHVMDAARIAADHACPIYAWTQPTSNLWLNRMFSQMTGWELEISPYVVTHELGGAGKGRGEEMVVEGTAFRILHVPGHSPDSVCFYHEPSAQCFCGDTVFAQGIGRTDFPGGSEAQLIAGIREKIFVLPGPTKLLPGHGAFTTVGAEMTENPFLQG